MEIRQVAVLTLATALATGCAATVSDAPTAAQKVAEAKSSGTSADKTAQGTGWTYLDPGGAMHGYGWTACGGPVTVSADTSHLSDEAAERVRSALKKAAALWEPASGIDFTSVGSIPLKFDPAQQLMVPVDGPLRERHIYLALEPEVDAPRLDGDVVGLGTPVLIRNELAEIVGGEAVFESGYVNKQSKSYLVHLFTHEIGHILGLGHAPAGGNIMHAIVTNRTALGPGDKAGIQAVTKPCPA